MKTLITRILRCCSTALIFMVAGMGSPLVSQELVQMPPLAPEIAALPRLEGESPTARRINAQLDQLDARDLDELSCYRGESDGPGRSVVVLSNGPEFLSFEVALGTFCEGAAHPWWRQGTYNFDLQTGDQTDLFAYLPETWSHGEGEKLALSILYFNAVSDLPADCIMAFVGEARRGGVDFELGLDESDGSLLMVPRGLAYVDTPCLNSANVPLAQLAEMGFGGKLIRALSEAP